MPSVLSRLRVFNPIRWRLGRVVGVAMVIAGLLLLTGVGSYYGYRAYASSQLDRLNASIEGPVSLPPEAVIAGFVPPGFHQPSKNSQEQTTSPTDSQLISPGRFFQLQLVDPSISQDPTQSSPSQDESLGLPVVSNASIYPAYQMHPKYWHQPLWAGTDPYSHEEIGLPVGYRPMAGIGAEVVEAGRAPARRISIPAIGVDSSVQELAIVALGDSRAYETPKNTVGHIPQTPNPGESGNAWFFGHLESPIKGEGSVFRRLPELSQYLKNGDPVYVTIESEGGEYLYQVTSTRVVHQNELKLYDSDNALITLVACVPRLVYDHRILVTAELVGIKN